jgi:hypothetical protein
VTVVADASRRRAALAQPPSSPAKATALTSASRTAAPSACNRANVASSSASLASARAHRRRRLVLLPRLFARRVDRLRVRSQLDRGAVPAVERAEQRRIGGGSMLEVERRRSGPCRLRNRSCLGRVVLRQQRGEQVDAGECQGQHRARGGIGVVDLAVHNGDAILRPYQRSGG